MKKLTPMRAIRFKCLKCCCGSISGVRLCTIDRRPLYTYRSGHRPKDEEIPIDDGSDEKLEDTEGFIESEDHSDDDEGTENEE